MNFFDKQEMQVNSDPSLEVDDVSHNDTTENSSSLSPSRDEVRSLDVGEHFTNKNNSNHDSPSTAITSPTSTNQQQTSSQQSVPPQGILRNAPPPLEVDYDANPTKLYKLVEAKDWHGSIARTRSNPEEAQTWVKRIERDTGKLRWKLLPLHAALILKSPGDVVAALVKVFPHGAQCRDDQGMLPLHLAFQKEAHEEAIDVLLSAYPEAVKVKDKRGKIPIERSRIDGHSTVVMTSYAHAAIQAERSSIVEEQERIYDAKFQSMHLRHKQDTDQVRARMQAEIDELQQIRHEALSSARELSLYDLSSTHNVIGVLKDEIERLKQTVSELTRINMAYKSALDDMATKRDDLSSALVRMAFEQDAIVKAAQQQKEGMDASNMVREKMMQAINQQEAESRLKSELERKAIMDLAQQQKKVIQSVIARNSGGVDVFASNGGNNGNSSSPSMIESDHDQTDYQI